MHILLTGATGYIGRRLLPILLEQGHTVTAVVRDKNRFREVHLALEVIEADFLAESPPESIPQSIDAAYYLMYSMSDTRGDFSLLEERQARNFTDAINRTSARRGKFVTAYSYHLDLNQFTCQKWQMNQQLFTDHNTLTAKQHIEQWLKSGIKQSKYCHRWGINVSTFANWYQKYKRGHEFQSKVLVEIKPPAVQYIEKSECRLDNNMVENTILTVRISGSLFFTSR